MSPEILLNLLADPRDLLRLTDLSLIVFDEAHNCTGRHPYARIMVKYAAEANMKYVTLTPLSLCYIGQGCYILHYIRLDLWNLMKFV